jgi:hypothetical protein
MMERGGKKGRVGITHESPTSVWGYFASGGMESLLE